MMPASLTRILSIIAFAGSIIPMQTCVTRIALLLTTQCHLRVISKRITTERLHFPTVLVQQRSVRSFSKSCSTLGLDMELTSIYLQRTSALTMSGNPCHEQVLYHRQA